MRSNKTDKNMQDAKKKAFFAGWISSINTLVENGMYDPKTNEQIMRETYQEWINGEWETFNETK